MWALWFVAHRLPSWVAWVHLLHSTFYLSSLTRDWTWVPCVGRQILNHWATREVPGLCLLYLSFILIILRGLPNTCHVWGKHGCGGSRDIAHDRALGTRKNRVQRSCLMLRRMSTSLTVGNTTLHWYLGLPSDTRYTPLGSNKDISILNTISGFITKILSGGRVLSLILTTPTQCGLMLIWKPAYPDVMLPCRSEQQGRHLWLGMWY